jgi:membrane associated rhomboid family serine protease
VSTPAPTPAEAGETCYRHPDRQSYIHCQRCGRTICPQCQTQAAVGVQCPECVREGRASYAASRPGGPGMPGILRRMLPSGSAPVVTFTIMGLCVVVYVAQWVAGQSFTSAFWLDPHLIRSEPWRLLTSAFLHSPSFVFHILFNLYALFVFGPALERFLGRARFLALYLIGALGGSLGEVLVYQLAVATGGASTRILGGLLAPAFSLGASGAIFALLGAVLVMRRAMGVNGVQLVIVLVINLAFSFLAPGIAWEAHVGGLLTGALIGAIFLATRRRSALARQVVLVAATAVGLVVICAICVVTAPAYYV